MHNVAWTRRRDASKGFKDAAAAYLQLKPRRSQVLVPLQYPASPPEANAGCGQTPWLLPFLQSEPAFRKHECCWQRVNGNRCGYFGSATARPAMPLAVGGAPVDSKPMTMSYCAKNWEGNRVPPLMTR